MEADCDLQAVKADQYLLVASVSLCSLRLEGMWGLQSHLEGLRVHSGKGLALSSSLVPCHLLVLSSVCMVMHAAGLLLCLTIIVSVWNMHFFRKKSTVHT